MGSIFLDSIASDLVRGDYASLDALFTSEALDPPVLIWEPDPAQLPVDPLPDLLAYWYDLPRIGDLPAAGALDPLAMKGALGHLMLLDVISDGQDFRYRVYGTKIAERSGFDMTGRLTSEINTSGYISRFFLAVYRAAMARRQAIYTRHNPPSEISARTWDRLVLPLVDDGGRISRILVGNVAGRWRSSLAVSDALR